MRVFMFPHHMDACALNRTLLRSSQENHLLGQMIFDLRTDQEKELHRQNGGIRNFRLQYNVWEERPQLILSELVESHKATWAQSIYQLKKQKQIVYISLEENIGEAFSFNKKKVLK